MGSLSACRAISTLCAVLVITFCNTCSVEGWIPQSRPNVNTAVKSDGCMGRMGMDAAELEQQIDPNQEQDEKSMVVHRRTMLSTVASVVGGTSFLILGYAPGAAYAATGSKDLGEEYRQGTAALGDMDEQAPVPREAYKKLPSGVIYADLRPGSGPTVQEGSRVNLQWVLRKSNGYFVDSSERNDGVPFIFTVGNPEQAIQGINEGVIGMKQGGTRRLLIPPSLAYVQGLDDGKPGPLPYGYGPRQQMRRVQNIRKDVPGEYIFLEVQVTRVQ